MPIGDIGEQIVNRVKKLGSFLVSSPKRRITAKRIVRPWRDDALRSHPSIGLTPRRLLAFLHAAEAGTPRLQFELFEEMLQRWPRLAAVEATRRLALTGLDWEILPDPAAAPNDTRAAESAEYCRATLAALPAFRDALDQLANAIAFGVSVAELVWDRGRLIDVVSVPYSRLVADPHEPWRLRVRVEEDSALGVALEEYPNKWIVHSPRPTPGRHFSAGLLRASSLLYVAQNLSFKDWLIYSQIAGMPVRLGRFEPGMPDDDKRRLLEVLSALGTEAAAVVANNVDVQLLEPRAGNKPYKPIQDYCNAEVTILWLGQNLTTDVSSQGSRAAAEVHDRVREDLLVDDVADESQTLRRDLLTPLVRARFGDAAPVPVFRRALIQSVDTQVLADVLAVAVRDLGLRVPRRWVHRALGIPEPVGDESILATEIKS